MKDKEWQKLYTLCEFLSEGGDCSECEKNSPRTQLWFESTSYEYPDEGEYYCRKCAKKKVEEDIAFYSSFGDKFKEETP